MARQPRGSGAPRPTHWEVELYERTDGVQPIEVFFDSIDPVVFQRLVGFIDNIAQNPVSFPPGPAWQAMHGPTLGCHEVRVRVGKELFRIFVRLDSGPFSGFPNLGRFVLLDGASKPVGTELPPEVYQRIGDLAADYLQTRKVSPPES